MNRLSEKKSCNNKTIKVEGERQTWETKRARERERICVESTREILKKEKKEDLRKSRTKKNYKNKSTNWVANKKRITIKQRRSVTILVILKMKE